MFRELAYYLLVFTSLIYMLHLGFYIVGANVYDIKLLIRKSKYKRLHRKIPVVSVIIPAYNEQFGIVKTLNSVLASSYRRIEIIIVDDGSKDATAKVVSDYLKNSSRLLPNSYKDRKYKNKKNKLRLVKAIIGQTSVTLVSQSNGGKAEAVNNGVINYAQGDLVMTLDADSTIDKDAIKNAVSYFKDPRIVGVASNVRVISDGTALGVLQKIEHMIGYRSKKFYTITNCEFIVGGVASTYRMDVLQKVGFYDTDTQTEDIGLSMKIVTELGNAHSRIIYASDVLAYTEGVQSYKALFKQRYRWKLGMLQNLRKNAILFTNNDIKYSRMLTMYRIPMAYIGEAILMIEPVLLMYILYLSITSMNVTMLAGAYGTITAYILWTLLPDEYMSIKEKIKYSLISPFMYFMFYIMNVVQIVAVIKCIFNHKLVFGRVKTNSSWESPERAAAIANS